MIRMLRALGPDDRQIVLDYAYRREREHLFLLGSFNRYREPFRENVLFGYFDNEALVGIGTFFTRFRSLVLHAQEIPVIDALADAFVQRRCPVQFVPAYERYARPTIERLRTYGIIPGMILEQGLFRVDAGSFVDTPSPDVRRAAEADRDKILMLIRRVDDVDTAPPIDDDERGKIFIPYEFVLVKDGCIVARACTHGESEHSVQVGGVVTDPLERGKGYGKQITAAICRHWLAQGKDIILFCRDDNDHALRIYRSLGFQPFDRFIAAVYRPVLPF